MPDAAEIFRTNVRNVMDERGLKIAELARAIGTARPSMSRILSGKERVTLDRAERIAHELRVELADLLLANGNHPAPNGKKPHGKKPGRAA